VQKREKAESLQVGLDVGRQDTVHLQLEPTSLVGQVNLMPVIVGHRKTGKSDQLIRFFALKKKFQFPVDICGHNELSLDVFPPEVDLDGHQALVGQVRHQRKRYLLTTIVINTETNLLNTVTAA
jgi:hypothetical protein